jgi:hypothetical protein
MLNEKVSHLVRILTTSELLTLRLPSGVGTTVTIQHRTREEITDEECLLPFSSEAFVLFINANNKVQRTTILPIVLYECETWFLPLTKEHRLRIFENILLRRIFAPKGGQ